MTRRDMDKVKVLINEAKVWCDSHEEIATVLDDDCEEIPFHCLGLSTVKWILEDLKQKLLTDDDPFSHPDKLRECPHCHSQKVRVKATEGSEGNWPASAYIECKDCELRSREYDGADHTDIEGAILKATVAWNRRF